MQARSAQSMTIRIFVMEGGITIIFVPQIRIYGRY